MYQNKIVQRLRSVLRKFGLTKVFGTILSKKNYEQLFDKALLEEIEPTDVVFDIGANQGFYTEKFLKKVNRGKVFAFEPVPSCITNLEKLKLNYPQLNILPIAIGSETSEFPMKIGNDLLNATSSIKAIKEKGDIMVLVESLDEIINSGIPVPNVIKIDVEGFELEVLKGMKKTLQDKNLRLLAIEIHFKLLEEKGYKNAPKSILHILKQHGFKIKWVDYSHLTAKRKK